MSDRPFFLPASVDDIQTVAIGVAVTAWRDERWPHAGMLFRDEPKKGGAIRVLEMCLDGTVLSRDAERAENFAWAVPQITPDQANNVAEFCDTIARRNPKLRYGFRFLEDSLLADTGTSIDIGGGSVGLTCATFVLAIFQSVGIRLAALESWQERPADRTWQLKWMKKICDDPAMGGYGLDPIRLERARSELDFPCLRYTPQDVVGVCRAGNHPTPYIIAVPLADHLWAWLNALLDMREAAKAAITPR